MSGQLAVITCRCGKKYKHFSSYKKHFLSCIAIPNSRNQQLVVLAEQRQIYSPILAPEQIDYANSLVQEDVAPANIQHNSVIKEKCPFCQLKINSDRLKNHISNICQQRFKNTPEYIELSKLGLITPGLTNKEIRAMCRVIQHLSATGQFISAQI